ncbi:MAG: OmpA family protein [Bacteroidota bacterium]|nr:OmpA family protein [Bacteroidota bacterium]
MCKKCCFISIALVVFLMPGMAQENVQFKRSNFPDSKSELKSAKRQIRNGDKAMDNNADPQKAINHYMKAQEFNPDNAELNYKIGSAYLLSLEKTKALSYLEKAYSLDKNVRDDVLFKLGRARHLNYQFEQALNSYSAYLSMFPKMDEAKKNEVNKHLTECLSGLELMKDTVDVEISNLGPNINTEYPEYNPMILADGSRLIFTARRKYIGNPIDEADGKYCEDVWYADKKEDGSWSKSKRFKSPLNTKGHDAISGISTDGQVMYVYKAQTKQGGDIFFSRQDGDDWEDPRSFGEPINTEYHESKVSVSYDEKTMYIVSTRPEDNYGGRDIFVSKKEPWGSWGELVNIGPVINTEYDEEGVLIHPDGRTLYFCSKGHNSMGGFDIFRSVRDTNGNWSVPPVNLGYPINTPDDEAFFSIAADGRHAYISSARPDGYGSYDIYQILYPEKEEWDEKEQVKSRLTLFTGIVKDAKTLQPLKASIEIVDNEKNEKIVELTSNEATGKFVASMPAGKNYGLSVNKEGYMFHSENFNIADTYEFQNIKKEVLLQPIEVGTKIVLKNIFFDYDKATLRESSYNELNKVLEVLKYNPKLVIEISGHTDNKGSLEYNLKLSRERAKSVVDYLIEHGVDRDRLKYEGYAFKQPIADNDTEKGRQLNRRVEFTVLRND